MSGSDLNGWTPLRIRWRGDDPNLDWHNLGDAKFTEPFFEQTARRVLRDPARLLFRQSTPLEALTAFAGDSNALRPTGFVFHLSRCGSTLVAQMLAALPQNIVISEAPPIDQLLSLQHRDPKVTHAQRLTWFRGLIAALGQRRRPEERHYFVKFDSWHVLQLPFILEAFPDVPWLFLYRDPVEIMVSQQRMRGIQMIPQIVDPRRFGFEVESAGPSSPESYCARVLSRTAGAALEHASCGKSRLVNFGELPEIVWQSLGSFFGVHWSEADLELLRRASQTNAKSPGLPYADDRAAKQQAASPELRRLADEWLGSIYAQLEEKRLAQTRTAAVAASANSRSRSQSLTAQSMTR